MHCGLCCRCGSLPLGQSRTAPPRSRSPFQLWARPPPLPPSLSLFKTPHTQTRVFNMPWRTPQQQQQQTTKGSDSKTKTAVWESSNQGKLRLYNGSFCLCVQSPWCWVSLRGQRKVSYIDSCATTPTSLESTLRLKVALSLTPLVVFAGLRVSLHAVVQFHQDRFQTGVHPLDQLMVHHQRPQQNTQCWKAANMVFCCCRFNYCTDSYYYSLPDTLCYGSPII